MSRTRHSNLHELRPITRGPVKSHPPGFAVSLSASACMCHMDREIVSLQRLNDMSVNRHVLIMLASSTNAFEKDQQSCGY